MSYLQSTWLGAANACGILAAQRFAFSTGAKNLKVVARTADAVIKLTLFRNAHEA
jgi:hypothetical protein